MKAQSVLRGSVWLIASALIAKVLGAVFRIPLTAALGGTGMGYYSSAYGLFLPVFALSVTGINTAAAALTAQACGKGRPQDAARLIRIALRIFGLGGMLGSLVLFFSAELLCTHLLQNPRAALAVRCFAPAVWFCCINAVLRGEAEGLRQMKPTAVSQIAEGLGRVCFGLLLCCAVLRFPEQVLRLLPQGTEITEAAAAAAILGVTLSTATGTCVMLLARRHLVFPAARHHEPPAADADLRRALMQIALPVAAASLVTDLTTLIDTATAVRLLRTALRGQPAAADTANFLYGAFSGLAVTVCNLVPSVTNMLGKGVLPAFSAAYAGRDSAAMQTHAEAVLSRTAFLAIPAGLGISALSEPILRLLFAGRPQETAAAAVPLSVLGLAVICTALSYPLFSMLQASGFAAETVKVMLIGAAVKLAGNLLLIPRLMLRGAALSTVISCAVILAGAYAAFRRRTQIRISLLRSCTRPMIGGIICAAAASRVHGALQTARPGFAALSSAVLAGGCCYLLVYVPVLLRRKQTKPVTAP